MRWVLCLMMLATTGFAPAPVYRPSNHVSDRDKLQGTWRSVAFRIDGRTIDMKASWKFYNVDCDFEFMGYQYRIDTRFAPKTIELSMLGRAMPGRVLYKFEGDSLIVCFDQGFETTPPSFRSDGKGRHLIVFERQTER